MHAMHIATKFCTSQPQPSLCDRLCIVFGDLIDGLGDSVNATLDCADGLRLLGRRLR